MLKVKKLRKSAILPTKAHNGDAGFDFYTDEDFVILPWKRKTIGLGLAVEFSKDYLLKVEDKSGLGVKDGLFVIAGVIDSTYRGEIHCCLANFSDNIKRFKAGEKVTQMILIPCYTGTEVEEVQELSDTNRGEGGFGSTGR